MKTKNCTVKLVEYTSEKIENLIKQIEGVFDNVSNSTIKKIEWPKSDDGDEFSDFRTLVSFSCSGTKNDIYKLMNDIKPNPINFN